MSYGAVLNPALREKKPDHPAIDVIASVSDLGDLADIVAAATAKAESLTVLKCAEELAKALSVRVATGDITSKPHLLNIIDKVIREYYGTEPPSERPRPVAREIRARGTTYPSPGEIIDRLSAGVWTIKDIIGEMGLDASLPAHRSAIDIRVKALVESGKLVHVGVDTTANSPRKPALYRKE